MPHSFPLQLICVFSPYKAVTGLRTGEKYFEWSACGKFVKCLPQVLCGAILCRFCLTYVVKTPSTIDMTCIFITDFGFITGPLKSKCSAYWYLLATWIITSLTKLSICAALPREGINCGIWNFAAPCQVLHLNMKLLHINKMISNQQLLEPNPWNILSTIQENLPTPTTHN